MHPLIMELRVDRPPWAVACTSTTPDAAMMVELPSEESGGIGLWRSLVAHLTGGQGVAGSNPVSPTEKRPGITRKVAGSGPLVSAVRTGGGQRVHHSLEVLPCTVQRALRRTATVPARVNKARPAR